MEGQGWSICEFITEDEKHHMKVIAGLEDSMVDFSASLEVILKIYV